MNQKLMDQTGAMRDSYREHKTKLDLAMCFKKKRYHSLKLAERVADKVFAERKVGLRAYCCPVCNGYHLTHKAANNATGNNRADSK